MLKKKRKFRFPTLWALWVAKAVEICVRGPSAVGVGIHDGFWDIAVEVLATRRSLWQRENNREIEEVGEPVGGAVGGQESSHVEGFGRHTFVFRIILNQSLCFRLFGLSNSSFRK